MASLTKKCRCGRAAWDTCRHTWLIRSRVAGKDVYVGVGSDLARAERALASSERQSHETVTQTMNTWLEAKEADRDARPNSLSVYRSRVKHIVAYFGDVPTRSLRPDDLSTFVADLLATKVRGKPISPATVQGIYGALTASLRHARRRGVIAHLPLPEGGVGIPSVSPRSPALTLDQIEGVIGAMPGVWGQVAELVLLTGLRWGEVVAIEPGDVDGHFVHVRRTQNRSGSTNPPKTRAGVRVVPLSPRASQILDVLDLPVGGDYRDARKALVAAMGELHQPGYGWHSIRGAHASLLEEAGVTLRDQARRLGHGHAHAVTLSYGLRGEAGYADALDVVRQRPDPSGGEGGEVVPLAPRRRRGPP